MWEAISTMNSDCAGKVIKVPSFRVTLNYHLVPHILKAYLVLRE